MNLLGWYSIGAVTVIFVVFYFVRKIPVYGGLCLATVASFGVLTFPLLDLRQPAEWVVATLGLLLASFGLLIVRVMLIRSVSLRLLGRLAVGEAETTGEDIGGRLDDMRAFRLIDTRDGNCQLTPFGRLVGRSMAAFYALFRIAR